MQEPGTQNREGRCPRCLEPVPPKAVRCARCGEPIRKSMNIRFVLAVCGLLMFVGVVVVAFVLMRTTARTGARDSQTSGQEAPVPPPQKPALGQ